MTNCEKCLKTGKIDDLYFLCDEFYLCFSKEMADREKLKHEQAGRKVLVRGNGDNYTIFIFN